MKKTILAITVLAVAGTSGAAYLYLTGAEAAGPDVSTVPVSRGSIVQIVQASGTLEAVTTVQVGTQVSGTIQTLNADFNSVVRKGQVVATLDPSLFETQIEQARATLVRTAADGERLRVQAESARLSLERTAQLAARQLVSAADLDAARVTLRMAEAQLQSAEAQVVQAEASLNQSEVNLDHTVIRAPIDGIVISRNVDVGQTVAASMSAPTLFVIAEDLTRMQANASIDESDVGKVEPGQAVTFTVDAYPGEEFSGRVSQVRLMGAVVQNVVTYTTMIDVPNPDLRLKPGMTANIVVEVARRDAALRIPSQALRFKPSTEVLASLGVPAQGAVPAPTQDAGLVRTARGSLASAGGIERAVLRIGVSDSIAGTRRDGPLAEPAAQPASVGTVWVADNHTIRPVRVALGVTDGTYVELVAGDLDAGMELVTRVNLAAPATVSPSAPVSSPLVPARPAGPPPPPPQ
ncbi:MAG: efflux RND transporter periplasmic adaptor subunit [Acidobacteriota bacterium]